MGNHVHKLLKVKYRYTFVNHKYKCCCKQDSSIETICSNIEEVSLTSTTMQREVKSVTEKFREAFKLFGACHNGYNGGPMSDANIEQLRKYSELLYVPSFIKLLLQKKTSRPSWTLTGGTFLTQVSSPSSTSWNNTLSLG